MSDDSVLSRKIAEVELSNSLTTQSRLFDETSAAWRWLLASLLAVNGGGALGILASNAVHKPGVVFAGAAFSSGAFCTLLLAYFTQLALARMIQPTAEISGYWIVALQSGSFDLDVIKTKRQEVINKTRPYRVMASIVGWAAALCFASGVIAIGLNLK